MTAVEELHQHCPQLTHTAESEQAELEQHFPSHEGTPPWERSVSIWTLLLIIAKAIFELNTRLSRLESGSK